MNRKIVNIYLAKNSFCIQSLKIFVKKYNKKTDLNNFKMLTEKSYSYWNSKNVFIKQIMGKSRHKIKSCDKPTNVLEN